MVEYPKLTGSEIFSSKTVTNGHSHFLLLENQERVLKWGEESKLKIQLAERLSSGRKGFSYKCKVVGIIVGNIPGIEDEINMLIDRNWPLVLIEDSQVSQDIKELKNGEEVKNASESILILYRIKEDSILFKDN
jgi:hypothetical protein